MKWLLKILPQTQQNASDYLKPVKVRIFIKNVHIAITTFSPV